MKNVMFLTMFVLIFFMVSCGEDTDEKTSDDSCQIIGDKSCGFTSDGRHAETECMLLSAENPDQKEWVIKNICGELQCCYKGSCVSLSEGVDHDVAKCYLQKSGEECANHDDCERGLYCGSDDLCEGECDSVECGPSKYDKNVDCGECEEGFYCTSKGECADDPCIPDICHGHGTCDGGVCECENEYMTEYCEACKDGYHNYPDCTLILTYVDSDTGLEWQDPNIDDEMDWYDAKDYCDGLSLDGHIDWRLPTISELKTLIQNCPATETGGSCGVKDSCLSSTECENSDCGGCPYDASGKYSVFGDIHMFQSSSGCAGSPNFAWIVYFQSGSLHGYSKTSTFSVRCVRDY